MDELKIPTTAREIRNMSFEEMDDLIAKFEHEKERRRKAEITNVVNKINDAIHEAQALGFRIIIDVAAGRGIDIEYNDNVSIQVTR